MKSYGKIALTLLVYFGLAALTFALTFAWVCYTTSRSSGDNLGAGPIGMASIVLMAWSLIGARLVDRTSRSWTRLSEALQWFRCFFIVVAFVAPTGFFGSFAIYLMIGYFKA